jgi:hypothetical protein
MHPHAGLGPFVEGEQEDFLSPAAHGGDHAFA